MTYETLRVSQTDGVATIQLHRPEAMNAISSTLIRELAAALEAADADAVVRAIVLCGGQRFFCAGADISEVTRAGPAMAGFRFSRMFQRCCCRLEECTKVVVGAVEGWALGGGFELILACDLLVVAEDARLGLPEVKIGAIPGAGGTVRTVRLLGPKLAKELVLLGEPITGRQAAAWGLANRAVPAEQVLETAMAMARQVAQRAPVAVQVAKQVMNRSQSQDLESALHHEAQGLALLAGTADFIEGTQAFLQKRPPVFQGR